MIVAASAAVFHKLDLEFGHLTFRAAAIDLAIGRIYTQSLSVQDVGE
jgi:hypothetical protein